MEKLKKLEEIQRIMMLMESHGIVSPSHCPSDSSRFLAQFILFLKEPSGNLNFNDKCLLLSHHLPKITAPSFLDQALLVPPENGTGTVSEFPDPVDLVQNNAAPASATTAGDYHGSGTDSNRQDVALIGLDAMQRANSTLEDFCRSYFMFHGMDVTRPEFIFKYLPVLSFTESYIYQLDSLNEKIVDVCKSTATVPDERSRVEADSTWVCGSMRTFESDPFQPLSLLLEQHGLLTERIKEELKLGEEYWSLERKLCVALERRVEEILIEDVMRAIHLKSFDYRVLNLLLYQLKGGKVNDLHMEFLSVSEFLVEISDDLFDYEEDVLENNFNILRMFVRVYGTSAAPTMLAKYITEAEQKYEELSNALDAELSLSYRRRCEEATREGGKISGYSLGSWTIPPLIVDEELYRSSIQSCS